jgi:hypothetical protein
MEKDPPDPARSDAVWATVGKPAPLCKTPPTPNRQRPLTKALARALEVARVGETEATVVLAVAGAAVEDGDGAATVKPPRYSISSTGHRLSLTGELVGTYIRGVH